MSSRTFAAYLVIAACKASVISDLLVEGYKTGETIGNPGFGVDVSAPMSFTAA